MTATITFTPEASVQRERVDAKVVGALVNRFVADSGEFLRSFACRSEAKLLDLGKRLQRLEALVEIIETKVRHVGPDEDLAPDANLGEARPDTEPAPGKAAVDHVPSAEPVTEQILPAPAAVLPVDKASGDPEAAPEVDERYMVYQRMLRTGVPMLAVRQRLLMDAIGDPTLDVSLLDRVACPAGSAAARAPAKATSLPTIETDPAASVSLAVQPPVHPEADPAAPAAVVQATEATPGGMAAAAAAIAARRMQKRMLERSAVPSAPNEAETVQNSAPAAEVTASVAVAEGTPLLLQTASPATMDATPGGLAAAAAAIAARRLQRKSMASSGPSVSTSAASPERPSRSAPDGIAPVATEAKTGHAAQLPTAVETRVAPPFAPKKVAPTAAPTVVATEDATSLAAPPGRPFRDNGPPVKESTDNRVPAVPNTKLPSPGGLFGPVAPASQSTTDQLPGGLFGTGVPASPNATGQMPLPGGLFGNFTPVLSGGTDQPMNRPKSPPLSPKDDAAQAALRLWSSMQEEEKDDDSDHGW